MDSSVDAQKVARNITEPGDGFEFSGLFPTRRNYVRSEEQLASYFRSAAGIAKLRSLIQEPSDVEELKRLVKIQYKNDFISWNDFYYDDTRYHVLFNRLIKGNLLHPVAVRITLKGQAEFYKEAKYFPWSFKCFSQIKKENNQKIVYRPKLQLAKESFCRSMSDGETFLIVGDVWAKQAQDNNLIFRNFNISIFNESQFKKELDAYSNT